MNDMASEKDFTYVSNKNEDPLFKCTICEGVSKNPVNLFPLNTDELPNLSERMEKDTLNSFITKYLLPLKKKVEYPDSRKEKVEYSDSSLVYFDVKRGTSTGGTSMGDNITEFTISRHTANERSPIKVEGSYNVHSNSNKRSMACFRMALSTMSREKAANSVDCLPQTLEYKGFKQSPDQKKLIRNYTGNQIVFFKRNCYAKYIHPFGTEFGVISNPKGLSYYDNRMNRDSPGVKSFGERRTFFNDKGQTRHQTSQNIRCNADDKLEGNDKDLIISNKRDKDGRFGIFKKVQEPNDDKNGRSEEFKHGQFGPTILRSETDNNSAKKKAKFDRPFEKKLSNIQIL